jgi:hypothetical protein
LAFLLSFSFFAFDIAACLCLSLTAAVWFLFAAIAAKSAPTIPRWCFTVFRDVFFATSFLVHTTVDLGPGDFTPPFAGGLVIAVDLDDVLSQTNADISACAYIYMISDFIFDLTRVFALGEEGGGFGGGEAEGLVGVNWKEEWREREEEWRRTFESP